MTGQPGVAAYGSRQLDGDEDQQPLTPKEHAMNGFTMAVEYLDAERGEWATEYV